MRPVEINREYIEKWSIPEPNSGCWLWLGGAHGVRKTRPRIETRRDGVVSVELAYRAAYRVFVGSIPEKLFVCHHCDNPMCVNPDHLFIGSHKDNMKDMREKRRQAKGDRVHLAKLSEDDVKRIRELRPKRRFTSQVARELGLSYQAVWLVLTGKTWGWLQ